MVSLVMGPLQAKSSPYKNTEIGFNADCRGSNKYGLVRRVERGYSLDQESMES